MIKNNNISKIKECIKVLINFLKAWESQLQSIGII